MADGRHLENRKISIFSATVRPLLTKFGMVTRFNSLTATGLDAVCSANSCAPEEPRIVAGAHCHILANTTEPSVRGGKRLAVQKSGTDRGGLYG